jgi:hypothetical protein
VATEPVDVEVSRRQRGETCQLVRALLAGKAEPVVLHGAAPPGDGGGAEDDVVGVSGLEVDDVWLCLHAHDAVGVGKVGRQPVWQAWSEASVGDGHGLLGVSELVVAQEERVRDPRVRTYCRAALREREIVLVRQRLSIGDEENRVLVRPARLHQLDIA